jgi:hypothetical protein
MFIDTRTTRQNVRDTLPMTSCRAVKLTSSHSNCHMSRITRRAVTPSIRVSTFAFRYINQASSFNDAYMNPKNRDCPGDNLKKITDYFTRRKSSDVGSTQALSTPTPRTSRGRRVRQKGEELGTFLKASRQSMPSQRTESNASTLSKRMRSPDAVPRSKTTAASPGPKRSKRQRKFDSDSDVDMTDSAVIYVKPSVRTTPNQP